MARIVPSIVVSVIERTYPWTRGQGVASLGPDQAPNVGMLIELVDAIPEDLLPRDSQSRATVAAALGAMRGALQSWTSGGHPGYSSHLTGMSAFNGSNPVAALCAVLANCPDEAAEENIHGLEFVENVSARESLRTDISAAHRALGNGEYKAATVLAGAVIEAALLWAISSNPEASLSEPTNRVNSRRKQSGLKPLDSRGVEHWHLNDFTDVAAELGILDPTATALVHISNDFRNLIHAGRVLRSGADCSQATALSAMGGMERVLEILARRAA